MGLPTTLAGLAGFVLFVVFIIGISASDIYPDESQNIINAQGEFINNLNISTNSTSSTNTHGFWNSIFGVVGLDGIYNFIIQFASIVVSFIALMIQYLLLFIGISTILPTEFYLLFALLLSSTIIAIVKLIFMAGE